MHSIVKSIQEINEEMVLVHHKRKLRKPRTYPLARPESYLSRMIHAVRKVPVPITSEEEVLELAIQDLELKPASQFEVRRVVNEIRKALKLSQLPNPRPARLEEVVHIALPKFLQKLDLFPKEYALYLGSLYAGGCRFAEMPLAEIKEGWLYVSQQLRDDGRVWRTKNGCKRHAAILPPLLSVITAYRALPDNTRANLRVEHYDKLYGASTRILGVNLHALRHSYAIECAKRNKSLEEIASYLGDTVEVARKHYIGYIKPTREPWG